MRQASYFMHGTRVPVIEGGVNVLSKAITQAKDAICEAPEKASTANAAECILKEQPPKDPILEEGCIIFLYRRPLLQVQVTWVHPPLAALASLGLQLSSLRRCLCCIVKGSTRPVGCKAHFGCSKCAELLVSNMQHAMQAMGGCAPSA